MRPGALLRCLALASLLVPGAAPRPVFAQAAGMPIPIAASGASVAALLAAPLILLWLTSPSDLQRLRTLDAQEDWDGIAALAGRRLAAHPGDPVWHELRGRALQRLGRCAEAVGDLRLAFDARVAEASPETTTTAFDTGLLLGLCQMALPDFAGAARTMEQIAAIDSQRGEPVYHLGVIRAHQGDLDAALAVLPALRARSAGMADSLQAYLSAMTRARTRTAVTTVAPHPAPRPGLPAGGRLAVAPLTLQLPSDWSWFQAPATQRSVRGGQLRSSVTNVTQVRIVTAGAYALEGDGSVSAVVAFSINPQQAFGTSHWNVDDPCAATGTVYLHRFRKTPDQPECAAVRIVDPAAGPSPAADLQGALEAAAATGAAWREPAYELHYAAYGLDRMVEVTVLVPLYAFAGEMAATQWLHVLAAQVRPLARRPSTHAAAIPPILAPR